MTLSLGDIAPDFEADTTQGRIAFHHWIGDSWAVLFSHPKDFTPVCTTELGYMARSSPNSGAGTSRSSASRLILSASTNNGPTTSRRHRVPARRIRSSATQTSMSRSCTACCRPVSGDPAQRTPADNQTVRNVFVIGPDKKVKLILVYPMTTGRNFDEVRRVIDSLQLTAKHRVSTPVNWKQGEDVIIAGSVSDEEAKQIFPGYRAPKPYLRITAQPRSAGAGIRLVVPGLGDRLTPQ